jgi:DNA-binding transcriptional ArsR family regulator
MIRYRFGQDDLLRTRFAIAPLIELVGAVYVLRDPARFAMHRPWAEPARRRIDALDLPLLDVVTPAGPRFWPVFVGPPPREPHATIAAELARVRATPTEQVVAEITRAYPAGVPPAAHPFVDDADAALAELSDQMQAFWDAALAPWWPKLSAALESEIAARARGLVAAGSQAAFAGLHQTVWWDDGILYVHPTTKPAADVDVAGRGLLLVPAVFAWPNVWPRTDAPWDPALVYPPPGIAELWAPDPPRADALKALIGDRRAAVLLELDRPASTLELAQRMQVSAGGVSDHLSILRRAGLVSRRRERRRVIYARTATGDALCRAGGGDHAAPPYASL